MRIRLLFLSLAASALFSVGYGQTVTVTGKKVTYTRPKPLMDFKRTFTVNHPQVKAATPALSKKIETAISFEKVIPLDIKEEIDEIQWLENADFEVVYNKNGALCVDLSIEGSGAYPSGSTKTVVVDTRTGSRTRPSDTFKNLDALTAVVKRTQRKEIAQAIVRIKKDPDYKEQNPGDPFVSSKFTNDDLDWFSIGDKGVTFNYDYGFPHAIQALQPDGKFFFTWRQLKPYIKPGSLLSRVAR